MGVRAALCPSIAVEVTSERINTRVEAPGDRSHTWAYNVHVSYDVHVEAYAAGGLHRRRMDERRLDALDDAAIEVDRVQHT